MNLISVEIIKDDLELAKQFLDDDNLDGFNYIGNRIMTNVLVDERNKDSENVMFIGWMLKQLGIELKKIGLEDPDVIDSSKTFIGNLKMMLDDNLNSNLLWEEYFTIEGKLRQYFLEVQENATYELSTDFSKKFAIRMLEIFDEFNFIVLDIDNRLISCITNELVRITNTFGGKEAYVVFIVFESLNNVYPYIMYEKSKGILDMAKANKIFRNICGLRYPIYNDDLDLLVDQARPLLYELGYEYRMNHLKYRDVVGTIILNPPEDNKRIIELPTEQKEKIGKIVKKSIAKKERKGRK